MVMMGEAGVVRRAVTLLGVLALAVAVPAHAEWMEARSPHFIVYSEESAAAARDTATRLERFDQVIRRLHKMEEVPGQASNPVTVYVVPSVDAVRRLYGGGDVAGFYVPRASGSVIFTPRRGQGGGPGDIKPQIVLFHEYAHHFLLGNSSIAYPAWFTEGYSEFVSTARLDTDFAQLGYAANHRAYGLYVTDLSIERLFDPRRKPMTGQEREALYGRGWLLTHYLIFDADRMAKFKTYLELINKGVAPIEAGTRAFGDLKQLDRALDRYMRSRKIPGLKIDYQNLPPVNVTVRPVSPGANALMAYRLRSERGVNPASAAPLYAKARGTAARYPNDPTAQGWLAEMAYDAGRDDEAEAAADRALAADPRSVQALLYKARVRLRRAQAAKATDPRIWAEARSWIVKANRLDPDDAEPLALFHASFAMANRPPTKSAVAGLARAFELMPQDRDLRLTVVRQRLADEDPEGAKAALRPLAYDPHSAPDGPAAKLLALLDTVRDPAAAVAAMERMDAGEEPKRD